jgi:hypothetical protein
LHQILFLALHRQCMGAIWPLICAMAADGEQLEELVIPVAYY